MISIVNVTNQARIPLPNGNRRMNWEIQLARPLRTHRCRLPTLIRTLGDAIDLIDEDLPEMLRFRPAWREVKEMLVIAAETRTGLAG
jgi:hypothetical protein